MNSHLDLTIAGLEPGNTENRLNLSKMSVFEDDGLVSGCQSGAIRECRVAPNGWRARVIAFYLPQFHPIPENDKWWGAGFTEWTNVAKAKPFYRGHQQPRLPADLGFYDLRVPETREAQAELAREYGVEGFCYWHYWFGNGRRILARPLNEVLATCKRNFPFCLAWANHSWTQIWNRKPRSMLIEQLYCGMEDERAHFLATFSRLLLFLHQRLWSRNAIHVLPSAIS